MTSDERNAMKDRERIKQFIEYTMRTAADDLSDATCVVGIYETVTEQMRVLSEIYKNMGFDKE